MCNNHPSAGFLHCMLNYLDSVLLQTNYSLIRKYQSNRFFHLREWGRLLSRTRGHDQNKITQFIFICYGREASGFRMAASSARLPQTQLQILIYDNLILTQITFPATMEIYPEKVWDFLLRDYCNSHELIY